MQLEYIILFNKIAQEKSISRVAAANHISQPALSQQMQRLEEEVGLKLFERSNRGIELTDAGHVMQKYALQFMRTYEQFREEIDNLARNSGTYRIAATSVAGNYTIPCTLFKLKSKFPNYTFTLSSMPSREVVRQVLDGQADVGFIVGEPEEAGLVCKKAFSDVVRLVAAKDYNVKEHITLDSLKKHPLIMLNENFSSYRFLLTQLRDLGCNIDDLRVLCHLDSTESVKASVIGKYGMAFLPHMAVKQELYLGQLKTVEAGELGLVYDVSMIYNPATSAGPVGAVTKYFESMVHTAIC